MMDEDLPISVTREVRDRCLCLHVQRAARALARRFDGALKPLGITSGQFSLLMSLNQPNGPRISDLVDVLGMDRTTLTAALKPLERRGLVQARRDARDGRARRLALTDAGRGLLKEAVPVWRLTHERIEDGLEEVGPDALRRGLVDLG